MEPALHSSSPLAGAHADLLDRVVADVAQGNDDAVFGRERPDRPLERVEADESLDVIRCITSVGIGHGQRSNPSGSDPIPTGVHDDSREPRVEAPGIAQVSEVPPRAEGRVVHRVLGLRAVAEDHGRQAVHAVELRLNKPTEGEAMVAGFRLGPPVSHV